MLVNAHTGGDEDNDDAYVHSHLLGTMRLADAVLPAMLAADSGRIVSIASGSGLYGAAGLTVHAAARQA